MATPQLLTARTEFASALNQICAERGITPESVLETIKSAILAAYRKDFGIKEEIEYDVEIDPNTGAAKVYEMKKKGKKDVTPPGFGRIAAQTAKQVILQKIREAEKSAILDEYQNKIGQLVSGMVLRFDGKDIICDIGRGQGRMPVEEQVKAEKYTLNRRLTLYILDIRETLRGKQIIVSRAANELVEKLFKREVPEVNSGAVEIKIVAREPGCRSKVAVVSTQAGVDPVGSCVGQKGVRVQAVIDELNGEKIDIIQYSDDPARFISAALSPAENIRIEIDEKKKTAVVLAAEDQLSLAIGRDGQNVRLAARLTGYKIDIKGIEQTKTKLGKAVKPVRTMEKKEEKKGKKPKSLKKAKKPKSDKKKTTQKR
ncbi:MAG TPA: transcription termination factor NusA [Candidatus Bathyarchaeia archaeon]|nr:transcription termination factor NusA [Candidatus Bathyarchaeia archaeon]